MKKNKCKFVSLEEINSISLNRPDEIKKLYHLQIKKIGQTDVLKILDTNHPDDPGFEVQSGEVFVNKFIFQITGNMYFIADAEQGYKKCLRELKRVS